MNRSLSIQPASALLGAGLACMVLLCMSQHTTSTFPTHRVECGPHPSDMIQFGGATPYIVPVGKSLTITAIGTINSVLATTSIKINGQPMFAVTPSYIQFDGGLSTYCPPASTEAPYLTLSMSEVPRDLTVSSGSVVETTRGWGYLTDNQPLTPGSIHRIECGPHPHDALQFDGTTPYTVPPGMVLTITAIGYVEIPAPVQWDVSHSPASIVVNVDGQAAFRAAPAHYQWPCFGSVSGFFPPAFPSSMVKVPRGFTVQSGSTVALLVTPNSPNPVPSTLASAWGYLSAK